MVCETILPRKSARSASVGLESTSTMYWWSGAGLAAFLPELAASSSSLLSGLADNSPWRTTSPNCAVEVTTTICLAFWPTVASFAGRSSNTVMMAGASKVSTTKERVRTRSRYSRLMISQVLRSDVLRIGLTDGLDKDFFQRGLHHLKPVQPRL